LSETGPRPKRILLCRTDRLGDVILSLPCATLLKRMFPDSRICFLARAYPVPSYRCMPMSTTSSNTSLERTPPNWSASCGIGKSTPRWRYFPSGRWLIAKDCGVPLRAGIAYRWHSRLFTYRHREHRKHNLRHEAEYNLNLTFAAFSTEGNWENLLPPEALFPLPLELLRKSRQEWPMFGRNSAHRPEIGRLHPGGGGPRTAGRSRITRIWRKP